jgi:hypothetical protein
MEIILIEYGGNWFATGRNNAIIRPHRLGKRVFARSACRLFGLRLPTISKALVRLPLWAMVGDRWGTTLYGGIAR